MSTSIIHGLQAAGSGLYQAGAYCLGTAAHLGAKAINLRGSIVSTGGRLCVPGSSNPTLSRGVAIVPSNILNKTTIELPGLVYGTRTFTVNSRSLQKFFEAAGMGSAFKGFFSLTAHQRGQAFLEAATKLQGPSYLTSAKNLASRLNPLPALRNITVKQAAIATATVAVAGLGIFAANHFDVLPALQGNAANLTGFNATNTTFFNGTNACVANATNLTEAVVNGTNTTGAAEVVEQAGINYPFVLSLATGTAILATLFVNRCLMPALRTPIVA